MIVYEGTPAEFAEYEKSLFSEDYTPPKEKSETQKSETTTKLNFGGVSLNLKDVYTISGTKPNFEEAVIEEYTPRMLLWLTGTITGKHYLYKYYYSVCVKPSIKDISCTCYIEDEKLWRSFETGDYVKLRVSLSTDGDGRLSFHLKPDGVIEHKKAGDTNAI